MFFSLLSSKIHSLLRLFFGVFVGGGVLVRRNVGHDDNVSFVVFEVLGDSLDGVVGRSTVLRVVESREFVSFGDSEDAGGLEDGEERNHGDQDPEGDCDEGEKLDGEHRSFSAVEESGAMVSVGSSHVCSASEEGWCDEAPCACGEVDRGRVDGVVDFEGDEDFGEGGVDDGSDEADDDGGPRFDDRAGGGDRDKAGQDAVADFGNVVDAVFILGGSLGDLEVED